MSIGVKLCLQPFHMFMPSPCALQALILISLQGMCMG